MAQEMSSRELSMPQVKARTKTDHACEQMQILAQSGFVGSVLVHFDGNGAQRFETKTVTKLEDKRIRMVGDS